MSQKLSLIKLTYLDPLALTSDTFWPYCFASWCNTQKHKSAPQQPQGESSLSDKFSVNEGQL